MRIAPEPLLRTVGKYRPLTANGPWVVEAGVAWIGESEGPALTSYPRSS